MLKGKIQPTAEFYIIYYNCSVTIRLGYKNVVKNGKEILTLEGNGNETYFTIIVTLDNKTTFKGKFSEIEIFTSSEF